MGPAPGTKRGLNCGHIKGAASHNFQHSEICFVLLFLFFNLFLLSYSCPTFFSGNVGSWERCQKLPTPILKSLLLDQAHTVQA